MFWATYNSALSPDPSSWSLEPNKEADVFLTGGTPELWKLKIVWLPLNNPPDGFDDYVLFANNPLELFPNNPLELFEKRPTGFEFPEENKPPVKLEVVLLPFEKRPVPLVKLVLGALEKRPPNKGLAGYFLFASLLLFYDSSFLTDTIFLYPG